MIKIEIYKDFNSVPGARYYTDGKWSGEEFFDKLLSPKFKEALDSKQKLIVMMDGTEGYPSSFISESFGRLGKTFGSNTVENNIEIISAEVPKYKRAAIQAIHEGAKK